MTAGRVKPKLPYSQNSMVGGSASIRRDSARFLIKRDLAEISQGWIKHSGLDRTPWQGRSNSPGCERARKSHST
jgi:hypothetical protein